jgi:hypothetical protein
VSRATERFTDRFNPRTGELLADEHVALRPTRISGYRVYLGTDRTDDIG